MLLIVSLSAVFFSLFVTIEAVEYEKCKFYERVYGRETKPIRLPHNREQGQTETVCQWDLYADNDRRVVFVCPFTINRIEDKQCRSTFSVTPEEGTEICANQGFTRVASNHRMTIHYKNTNSSNGDDFTCYAYGELATTWNKFQNSTEHEHMSHHIILRKNVVAHITSAFLPKIHPIPSIVRWTMVPPPEYGIFINCPFTNKPPRPLANQRAPCHGEFRILSQDKNVTIPCTQRSFTVSTQSEWLVFQYENKNGPPDDHFECFIGPELRSQSNHEIDSKSYESCDYIIKLASGQIVELRSPNYPQATPANKNISCRWTLSVPPGDEIALRVQGLRDLERGKCLGNLRIGKTDGSYKTECLDESFSRVTGDRTIVIYEDSTNSTKTPFKIFAFAKPLTLQSEVLAHFENSTCAQIINLEPSEMMRLNPGNFSQGKSYCRYTFIAPTGYKVAIACFAPGPKITEKLVMPCTSQFVVLIEGDRDAIHCSDTTFSRTSINAQMTLFYMNPGDWDGVPATCDVYAEPIVLKNPKLTKLHSGPQLFKDCDREIRLETHEMFELKSPHYPNNDGVWTSCRWRIVTSRDSRILLSCNYPDYTKPKNPGEPCSAYVEVEASGRYYLSDCRGTPFLRFSNSHRMVFEYVNQLAPSVEAFKCLLASELKWPWEPCEHCNANELKELRPGPFGWCDKTINLAWNAMTEILLLDESLQGIFCRWTLIAPEDRRIFLSCPLKNEDSKNPCRSTISVSSAGNKTLVCREKDTELYSVSNWMVILMEIPTLGDFRPLACFAYVEKTDNQNEWVDYDGWLETIELNNTVLTRDLTSPNYPFAMEIGKAFRWILRSPNETSIAISCPNENDEPLPWYKHCWGFFTVYDPQTQTKTTHCRHAPWGTKSTGNELIIDYKNNIGLSKQPFKCFTYLVENACSNQVFNLTYDSHFTLPIWKPESSACTWSFESPTDAAIYLTCDNLKNMANGTITFSKTGDRNFADGLTRRLDKELDQGSIKNKMSIKFNISDVKHSNDSFGCWIYVDKKPALNDECNCGVRNLVPKKLNNRMLNSVDAIDHEFPMMAGLADAGNHRFFCGATIISAKHALTSANCYYETRELTSLTAELLVGVLKFAYKGYLKHYIINKWSIHPSFKKGVPETDHLAIAHINGTMQFNDFVRPACLPFQYLGSSSNFKNEIVTVMGWGDLFDVSWATIATKRRPTFLQKAIGKVVSKKECQAKFKNFNGNRDLCIKYQKETTCRGDHGGPILWVDPKTSRLNLIGSIVAFKNQCSGPPFISYAINLMPHLNWIQQQLPKTKFCKT